jgi:hypothetical protein
VRRSSTVRDVVLVVGVAAAALVAQLFVEPVVGLADNGDFSRVMGPAGLRYPTDAPAERYWNWMLKSFPLGEPWIAGGRYATSESFLVGTAVSASRAAGRERIFDIRFLAAVHGLLLLAFLAAVTVATAPLPSAGRWLVRLLCVFVWTDVGYVAPLNSLYAQVASLLFFLLTAGVAALAVRRGALSGWLVPAFFACAALFVCSKPQASVQAPFLAVLGVTLQPPGRRWRSPVPWLAAGLCVLALVYYSRTPQREIRDVGLYDTVFMELLRTSPAPEQDLKDLGLDPALRRFTGVSAYATGAPLALPGFRAAFYERVGYGSIVRFYLTHPDRLGLRLQRAGHRSFRIRPGGLGNFEKASGRPALAQSRSFGAWSTVRASFGAPGFGAVGLLLGGNLAAAFGALRRGGSHRLFGGAVAVLVLMAALEFGVGVFADNLADLPRHLFVFHAMVDVLIIADVGWIASAVAARRESARA